MRLEWGRDGAARAAARGDIVVIVDVLSFSTAAVLATERGATVYPAASYEQAAEIAAQVGGEASVPRSDVPSKGRFSLSPATLLHADAATSIVLTSPNGATCCVLADNAPVVAIGALVNARATGEFLSRSLANGGPSVSVVACDERWTSPVLDGDLRFALEDYLGAGAIIGEILAPHSPEAAVCANAYRATANVEATLRECASGLELARLGYAGDVAHAARINSVATVALLSKGRIAAHADV